MIFLEPEHYFLAVEIYLRLGELHGYMSFDFENPVLSVNIFGRISFISAPVMHDIFRRSF